MTQKSISNLKEGIVLVGMFVIAWLGKVQLRPPAMLLDTAPAEQFSAQRATSHYKVIGQHPHLIGSKELSKVRSYIVEQLHHIGIEPELQESLYASRDPIIFAGESP